MKEIIYLASPYTSTDPQVMEKRYEAVTEMAARLIKEGKIIFSPITMTHPLDKLLADGDTLGSDYWLDFDEAFMEACSELYVYKLAGWEESSGVIREISFFEKKGRKITYIE
ncbi:DUF1937 family protein [Terasakiella pusilla]|uniref:DUF1937 family protein n=1 Tax=Terasakiella pusilla TaxID=64973 RepID=UPI003AA8EECE